MMTRSVHQIVRSAGQAAIHPMIPRTQITLRKPSASQLHHMPPLDTERLVPPPVKSASLPKWQRQSRSAPGTVSTIRQTIKPHLERRAALLLCSLKVKALRQIPFYQLVMFEIVCPLPSRTAIWLKSQVQPIPRVSNHFEFQHPSILCSDDLGPDFLGFLTSKYTNL